MLRKPFSFAIAVIALLLVAAVPSFAGPLVLPAPAIHAVAAGPRFVTAGDMDGNGITDLAVLSVTTPQVSVMLGTGGGAFAVAVPYAVAASPVAMAMRDLNHDGRADLVIAHGAGGGLTVLVAGPTGAYAATSHLAGATLGGLAVADLDGDGHADIVATEPGGGVVRVLRGQGTGAFQAPASFAAGSQPSSVAVGDLNGDGVPDIITGNQSGAALTLVMGLGGATFAAPVGSMALAGYHRHLLLEDVDGDGKADLLAQRESEWTVEFLKGQGTGSFATPVALDAGQGANGFVLTDVNGDGFRELVVALESRAAVAVFNGLASGQFGAPAVYGAGSGASGVAVADLDGDGKADVATANFFAGTIAVLRGRGAAGLDGVALYAWDGRNRAMIAGDFDGDGSYDVATLHSPPPFPRDSFGSLGFLRGDGLGFLMASGYSGVGMTPASLAMADFDGNGTNDLVATDGFMFETMQLVLVNASGGVASSSVLSDASNSGYSAAVAAGDVDADGNPDIVVANPTLGNLSLLRGNGNGTFQSATSVAAGGAVSGIVLVDVDGDGDADIVASNFNAGTVSLMKSNGNGTFLSPSSTTACTGPGPMVTADFNLDGRPDVAVLCGSGTVSILVGQAGGSLAGAGTFTAHADAASIATGDLDVDGNPDVVTGNGAAGSISVARGNGDGTFLAAVTLPVGAFAVKGVAVADFNSDGRPDVAVAIDNGGGPGLVLSGSVGLMLNRTLPPCDAGQAGDCDGDGIPNLVEATVGRNPEVKDNDIFSPGETAALLFAMQQYRDFLGREGDAAGIAGWTAAVSSGSWTRYQVIDAFVRSQEFGGFVAPVVRLYFALFLRIPDYAGLVFNAGLVRNGSATLQQLADFFASSPEFQTRYGSLTDTQYVTLLYQNVLGREPDAGGLAGWVALLGGGMSRGQVMLGFSDSAEFQATSANEVLVTMMYVAMLRRSPEPTGFADWVALLDGGYPRESAIAGFFNSVEYRDRFLP